MKKWLSLLLTLALLTGCSDVDSSSSSKTNEVENKNIVSEYPTYEATVEKVTDGDTLTISYKNKQQRVRLLLVDTPESVKQGVDPQPFSIEASNFVKELLPIGTKVIIEPGVEGHEYDKYNRLLAYVYVNGEMLNKTLIREGFARVGFIYKPNTRYLDEFLKIQDEAKLNKKNIWSIKGYVTEKGYNVDAATNATMNTTNQSENNSSRNQQEKIKGNTNSKIYHVPGGKYYDTPMKNIIWFDSVKEAEQAGYRASKE
ncbi:thermonuclease family protein [Bacillus massiliigorillae]|uniref:thermonuclease family protein n=1 Tax=Bacillus massiliigorillae TaxID=1243664 RepID=UPI0003A71EF5|nr:thermonuclease family protein [Bacillus massiliigorillae]